MSMFLKISYTWDLTYQFSQSRDISNYPIFQDERFSPKQKQQKIEMYIYFTT